jgi:hypothetical protein
MGDRIRGGTYDLVLSDRPRTEVAESVVVEDGTAQRRSLWLTALLAIAATAAIGLALLVALTFIGVSGPLYFGRDPAEDVPVTTPHAATAAQQRLYGVTGDAVVLAEVTAADHRVAGGADFYSVRFPLRPYEMVVRCAGETLGLQESINYRRRLRLQETSAGGHLACGQTEPQRLNYDGHGIVTVDVIDTQFVDAEWGVLIIRR